MDFTPYADDFVDHYRSVRGHVRLRLLHEQVAAHAPPGARVLDVGGGAGQLAALLAADGHRVTVLEPSGRMRQHGQRVMTDQGVEVVFEEGAATDVRSRPDAGHADVVLCHAVAPYVESLDTLVADLVPGVAPGGIVSLVVKNRDALAMRPALERRWQDVPAAVDADGDAGGLGVRNRAHGLSETIATLARHGCDEVAWYGIRVVSDALPYDADDDAADVLAAERALTAIDPYRRLGRLLHVVARRRSLDG